MRRFCSAVLLLVLVLSCAFEHTASDMNQPTGDCPDGDCNTKRMCLEGSGVANCSTTTTSTSSTAATETTPTTTESFRSEIRTVQFTSTASLPKTTTTVEPPPTMENCVLVNVEQSSSHAATTTTSRMEKQAEVKSTTAEPSTTASTSTVRPSTPPQSTMTSSEATTTSTSSSSAASTAHSTTSTATTVGTTATSSSSALPSSSTLAPSSHASSSQTPPDVSTTTTAPAPTSVVVTTPGTTVHVSTTTSLISVMPTCITCRRYNPQPNSTTTEVPGRESTVISSTTEAKTPSPQNDATSTDQSTAANTTVIPSTTTEAGATTLEHSTSTTTNESTTVTQSTTMTPTGSTAETNTVTFTPSTETARSTQSTKPSTTTTEWVSKSTWSNESSPNGETRTASAKSSSESTLEMTSFTSKSTTSRDENSTTNAPSSTRTSTELSTLGSEAEGTPKITTFVTENATDPHAKSTTTPVGTTVFTSTKENATEPIDIETTVISTVSSSEATETESTKSTTSTPRPQEASRSSSAESSTSTASSTITEEHIIDATRDYGSESSSSVQQTSPSSAATVSDYKKASSKVSAVPNAQTSSSTDATTPERTESTVEEELTTTENDLTSTEASTGSQSTVSHSEPVERSSDNTITTKLDTVTDEFLPTSTITAVQYSSRVTSTSAASESTAIDEFTAPIAAETSNSTTSDASTTLKTSTVFPESPQPSSPFRPPSKSKRSCFKNNKSTSVVFTTVFTTEEPSTVPSAAVTVVFKSTTTTEIPTTTTSLRKCFKERQTSVTAPTSTSVTVKDTVGSTEIIGTTEEAFNETSCETSCDEGWTEGETACFQAIPVTEPTTFANLSAICSRVGQSMPNRFDFSSRENYDTFSNLGFSHVPQLQWVFMEPEPTIGYRMKRLIKAVNVTRSHFADRQTRDFTQTEPTHDVMAICKKPKFCAPPKCNLSEYFLVPEAVNLIRTSQNDLFHVTQSVKVVCNLTTESLEITCQAKGFFTPYPDGIGCLAKNEVEEEKKRKEREEIIAGWNAEESISDCRQCSPHGTQNCTRKDDGTFQCSCLNGWVGTTCGKSPDYCNEKMSCKNGGVCMNYVTEFYCVCAGNFKGDDCSLNVAELDYSNEAIKSAFLPVTNLYVALSFVALLMFLVTLSTDCDHPQSTTQCVKHGAMFTAFVLSALFRHPGLMDLDPYVGCRLYNWLINMAWMTALFAWLFEAHLCWGTMSNNFMNVWDFEKRWHLYAHLRVPAILLAAFALATGGNFVFWDEVPHSWTCTGTFHESGLSHVVFLFGLNFGVVLLELSFAQVASNFRDESWYKHVRMYRTTVDDPFEYGKHMEVTEKNVKFVQIGAALHYALWLLAVAANDQYNDSISTAFIATAIVYFVFLAAQMLQTNRALLSMCKEAAILYGPYSLAPTHNFASLMSKDELIAKQNPQRFAQIQAKAADRRTRQKIREFEATEEQNEEVRQRFAKESGDSREECPSNILYHHPEEGPPQIYPEKFAFAPHEEAYIPEILREFFNAQFSVAYLKLRLSPENDALTACYKTNNSEFEKIVKEIDDGTLNLWMIFCRDVTERDSQLSEAHERISESLELYEKQELKQRMGTTSMEFTPMGPRLATILKDLDALMPCQTPHYMAEFNKDLADINKPFDKIYEDDLNIPPYADVVPKFDVQNVDNDARQISLNPRKRPLNEFFYDSKIPGFIGPLKKEDQLSACISQEERHRLFFKKRLIEEWEDEEEAGALLLAQRAFRKKHPVTFLDLMRSDRSDMENGGNHENAFLEDGLRHRK